jgi:hypothetical protein
MIRYLRQELCKGCGQCVQQLGAHQMRQEHVLSQEDVTLLVQGMTRPWTKPEVEDATVKEIVNDIKSNSS